MYIYLNNIGIYRSIQRISRIHCGLFIKLDILILRIMKVNGYPDSFFFKRQVAIYDPNNYTDDLSILQVKICLISDKGNMPT